MTNAAPTMEARNVLVTGAIRGLGLAFVKHLLSCSTHIVKLFAACRDPGTAQLSSVKYLSGYGLNFNVSFNAPCRYNNPLLIRIKKEATGTCINSSEPSDAWRPSDSLVTVIWAIIRTH